VTATLETYAKVSDTLKVSDTYSGKTKMITLLIQKAGFEPSGPDNGMRGPIANWMGCLPIFLIAEITRFKNSNVATITLSVTL